MLSLFWELKKLTQFSPNCLESAALNVYHPALNTGHNIQQFTPEKFQHEPETGELLISQDDC
ncbi:hypothetical protein A0H81_02211 [Grifola frondosa]|uniref:Uncharacterized protein n=1 Tax=Grifola frondosa TaxID=5627 RepID=A0A1C7ML62_GRIFR|nr:hypothetical protein A0H81_02211 [Grifola frondosa]